MATIDASTIFLLSFALMLGAEAFLKPCIYQSDKCGFTLMSTYGYNLSELVAAVNQTPSIPPLSQEQLTQVIYHCDDILGNLTGNTFCVNGCLNSISLLSDDECKIAGNGCPTTVTTTVTSFTGPPAPSCFKQCQTWCFGTNFTNQQLPRATETATPIWL